MENKQEQELSNPIEYFKDIAKVKNKIAQMLYDCGITLSPQMNVDGDCFFMSEKIKPNGGICVQFESGLPSSIITPFGKLMLEYIPFGDTQENQKKFTRLFERGFSAETFKYKRLTQPFNMIVGPDYTLKMLPWKWQRRLPDCKQPTQTIDFLKAQKSLSQICETVNQCFVKEGHPDLYINPVFTESNKTK